MPFATKNRILSAAAKVSIPYTVNQQRTEELSRAMVVYGWQLSLSGQLACTAANNTRANTRRGDELAVIKRITITVDGGDVIFNMTGEDLWHINRHFFGAQPPMSTVGDATTLNPSIGTALFIPFVRPRAYDIGDTLLDLRRYQSATVTIDWGTHTDINAAATGWTVNPSADITPIGFTRGAAGVDDEPLYSGLRYTLHEVDFAGATSNGELKLPTGPLYTGFLINQRDASGNDALIATDFQIESNNYRYCDWGTVRANYFGNAYTGAGFPFNAALNSGNGGEAFVRRSTATATNLGWTGYHPTFTGRLSESLDSFGLGEMKFKFNVTAAGRIRIISQIVNPAYRDRNMIYEKISEAELRQLTGQRTAA